MATHPAVREWTYAEFARLPDDGKRYEVIAGELEVTPSPRPKHQDVVGALAELLRPFVRQHQLGKLYPGPIDVLFAAGDYLVPDLVFVRREQLGTTEWLSKNRKWCVSAGRGSRSPTVQCSN